MKCPIDSSELVMSDRSGVEIDYCPQCRGVWLDRGELDKIVERSFGQSAGSAPLASGPQESNRGHGKSGHHGSDRGGYNDGRPRRRESWISDLFG